MGVCACADSSSLIAAFNRSDRWTNTGTNECDGFVIEPVRDPSRGPEILVQRNVPWKPVIL